MIVASPNYGINPFASLNQTGNQTDICSPSPDAEANRILDADLPSRFKHGTIVQISPTEEFKQFIKDSLVTFGIHDIMDIDKLHQTVYYAKEQFDPKIFDIIAQFKGNNFSMSSLSLTHFKGHDGKCILAIDYASPILEVLFDRIKSGTTLKHTFPELKLHITLNYDFIESNFFRDNFIEFSRHLATGASWKRDKFYLTELEAVPIIKNFSDKAGGNF